MKVPKIECCHNQGATTLFWVAVTATAITQFLWYCWARQPSLHVYNDQTQLYLSQILAWPPVGDELFMCENQIDKLICGEELCLAKIYCRSSIKPIDKKTMTDQFKLVNCHVINQQARKLWRRFFAAPAVEVFPHYDDVIMTTMASQITSLTIVYSTVYSGADQRKHQSSASLAIVRGIHRWPVNSPHKWPVTRKMFPFDDVIMWSISKPRICDGASLQGGPYKCFQDFYLYMCHSYRKYSNIYVIHRTYVNIIYTLYMCYILNANEISNAPTRLNM